MKYMQHITAALVLAALGSGCDSASEAPLQGTWEARGTPTYYLVIGEVEVAFYEPPEAPPEAALHGCYARTAYDVLDISGDTYVLRNPKDEAHPWRMTFSMEGEALTVAYEREEFGMSVEHYSRVHVRSALLEKSCAP